MVSLQLLFASTFLINGNAAAPIYWSYPLSDRLLVHILMVGVLQYIFSSISFLSISLHLKEEKKTPFGFRVPQ